MLEIPINYQATVHELLRRYAPDSTLAVQKVLTGGLTSACVLLVDLSKGELPTNIPPGEYVLKLDTQRIWDKPEPNESDRHKAARDWNADFANSHIPPLLAHVEQDKQLVLIYEIAGKSLINLVAADSLDAGALTLRGAEISRSLLADWNRGYEHRIMSPGDLLKDWLGYRLDPAQAPQLHKFIAERTGTRQFLLIGEEVLVNPLWFCMASFLHETPPSNHFVGHLHCDLHPGNIVIERHDPLGGQYWLIDFALSRTGPLLYDNAYLELALILRHLEGAATERIIGILKALQYPQDRPEASMVPVNDIGLLGAIRGIRNACDNWQLSAEPNRRDRFLSQQLLAMVAASLNWCNKPLKPAARELAFCYAGWMARKYLKTFRSDVWQQFVEESAHSQFIPPSATEDIPVDRLEADHANWNTLWEHVAKFDEARAKFVLVADCVGSSAEIASLGMLPWSAIIDLDPESDQTGLFSKAGPILSKIRSVQQFGLQPLSVDFDRGTAWIMAGGWPDRFEATPTSLRQWRQLYLPIIQNLMSNLREDVAPQPVIVVVLSSKGESGEKLSRIVEAIDERLGDLASFTIVGQDFGVDSTVSKSRFEIRLADFFASVRRMYGVDSDLPELQIPGGDSFVTIEIDQLRNLEEDIEVLHSQILSERFSNERASPNSFWRGNPPTWPDLHANLDIIRDGHSGLVEMIEKALQESRNYTIELHHSPGAGGTTAALRAAWTLRLRYATAVLRRYSRLTLDRIDQLFQLSQRPVLLVADASELPSSAREELYRGLAARNSRVVILYIVRTIQLNTDRSPNLSDPMPRTEARRFLERYLPLTKSHRRQNQLRRITESTDPLAERYRSPFFYGLITFERDFESIDRYVDAHTHGLAHRVRQILLYLALVTRYSQSGLDESLVSSLFELRSSSALDLAASFGEGATKLIVKHGRHLKLLHPLVAEEVLRLLLGGPEGDGWLYGIKDLALEFIRDAVRILGSDSTEAKRLFIQLFISRDVWFERQSRGRPRFSELINAMPTVTGQSQVLQLLTELCPNEAHYWNHLGRHHFYEVKQDFDRAEKYLERAVELSPEDSYHHHSLGMVRRFWIEHKLSELFEHDMAPTADQVLEEIQDLYGRASENFRKSRALNTDDEHGYITHLQMLLYVAERLLRASGGDLTRATAKPGPVSAWLTDNIILAEDLLSTVQHDRGPGNPSNYELRCETQLSSIYGSFEAIISSWEEKLNNSAGQSDLRRALALAYWARGKRSWSRLTPDELRRIASMMETNLRSDPTNERDIRTWFQAYRRLPEYGHLEALDRLNAWASRADSLDANYYLYILHFLLFREGNSRSEDFVRTYLQKCKELAHGRRGHSYEWLSKEPKWCPLINYGDLGDWPKGADFYTNTRLLDDVTGTIETIKGPQSGTIRLGPFLRAFFVPSTHHWMSKDINTVVHFYLGFSYDGFRAWSVRSGSAPLVTAAVSAEKTENAKGPTEPESGPPPSSVAEINAGVDERDLYERIKSIVFQLHAEWDAHNEKLFLTTIGDRLSIKFGPRAFQKLGYATLSDYLASIPGLQISGVMPKLYLERIDSGSSVPSMERVIELVFRNLEQCEALKRPAFVSVLGNRLREEFPGEPVHKRLGFPRLGALLRSIPGIVVEGQGFQQKIRRSIAQ